MFETICVLGLHNPPNVTFFPPKDLDTGMWVPLGSVERPWVPQDANHRGRLGRHTSQTRRTPGESFSPLEETDVHTHVTLLRRE